MPQWPCPPAAAAPRRPLPPARPRAATAGDVPVVAALAAATTPSSCQRAAAAVLNVRTDVLDVDVSLRGGELTRADLLNYPLVKGEATPVRLLRNSGPGEQYLLQTGLAGAGARAAPEAYPHAPGAVPQRLHRLRDAAAATTNCACR